MDTDISSVDARTGACIYIIHGLLQRLESQNPGLVQDLLNGAKADREAVKANCSLSEPVDKVFSETLNILERIHAQNQMVRASAP